MYLDGINCMKLLTCGVFLLAWATLSGQTEAVQRKFFSDVHEALALKAGSVVADVGTGDNPLHPLRMAEIVGLTGRVVCIDIDQKVLDKLKRNLPPGAANIEVQLGKAGDPLLPENSFDAVLVSNTYHEMSDPVAMLANIRKALRPTGRLVVIEAFVEIRRQLTREEQTSKHEFPPEILDSELRAAGFEIVRLIQPLFVDGPTVKYLIAAQPSKP